jgi:hypothetical protein
MRLIWIGGLGVVVWGLGVGLVGVYEKYSKNEKGSLSLLKYSMNERFEFIKVFYE